jgi:hypothetical protein
MRLFGGGDRLQALAMEGDGMGVRHVGSRHPAHHKAIRA